MSSIFSSLIWKFLERSGTQVVQFVVSIILARLLSPEDFGVIALVLIFIQLANVFIQSGFNSALIQKKDADNLDFSSVFWGSLIVTIFLYILLFISSPFIANYYERPILEPVLRVLGLTLFLGVFNSIQEAFIARNMLFKKLFYRSLGAIIPSGILGITLAYLGFAVWALVAQQLSNAFFICAIMWFTVKWRPEFLFSFNRLKSLFSYGWKLLVSALMDVGYNNLRSLVIGKMFTPATLGFYTRGNQFPNLIISNINSSIQSVMLPALSKEQDDLIKVKKMTRRAIVTSSFIILPLMAWLAAIAEPLVLIVLGKKWLPCVPFLQIYCLIYALWPIHTSNLSAIKAVGRSDLFLRLEIIKKILGLGILLNTVFIFHSPIAIALGGAVSGILSTFINAQPNKKLLSYGYFEQMKDILPFFVIAIIMGLGLWWLTRLHLSAIALLIILTLIGFLFYLAIAKLLHFECLDYLIKTIQEFRNGRK
jgi:teichuronic acid exporter